jgi:ubiquinone/menaquinone biosynthesis C-methylase UbiE
MSEAERIRTVYASRGATSRYSVLEPGHAFMLFEQGRRMLRALTKHGCSRLDAKRVLDIGCGTGYWLREFVQWGARPEHLTGVDLLADRIAKAQALCPATVSLRCADARALPFADDSFDIVLQSTVFTSVLDPAIRQRIAEEMLRVLSPDGLILWYDFHVGHPRNRDVRGVPKREVRALFPGCRLDLARATLAPPVVRILARYSWLACALLERIPFLCTHYVGAIWKEKIS